MRPALEEKMAEVRVDRLRQQRLDVLRARFPLLKHLVALFRMDTHGGFCPATRDLASCPEIRAIIESSFDDDITEESFDLIRPKMLDIVTHWKHDAMLVLEKAVRKEFPIPGDVDFTSLALCLVFKCAGCAINLLYLDLLHHPCLKRIHRNQANFLEEEPENMDDYDVAANDMIRYHPWCSSLVLVGNSNKVLRDIIIVCDQDPMRVTIDEMDKLDTRLVCKSCSTLGAVAVMTWRAAVSCSLFCDLDNVNIII